MIEKALDLSVLPRDSNVGAGNLSFKCFRDKFNSFWLTFIDSVSNIFDIIQSLQLRLLHELLSEEHLSRIFS